MSPKTDRRSKQGLESRMRIMEATFELAHEHGYQGTSIAKVSARSGLPASSVYWHFADKDALFVEMLQHSFDQWIASMPDWTAPRPGQDRRQAVAARIRSAVDSIASSPEFWRLGLLLSLERQAVELEARRRFVEIRRPVLDRIARFWQDVLPAGYETRTPDLPERLARFTMAASDGIFVSAQVDGPYDLTLLADLLVDSLEAAALRLG